MSPPGSAPLAYGGCCDSLSLNLSLTLTSPTVATYSGRITLPAPQVPATPPACDSPAGAPPALPAPRGSGWTEPGCARGWGGGRLAAATHGASHRAGRGRPIPCGPQAGTRWARGPVPAGSATLGPGGGGCTRALRESGAEGAPWSRRVTASAPAAPAASLGAGSAARKPALSLTPGLCRPLGADPRRRMPGCVCGGQQVFSSEKPPVLTPWGEGASQRSRMRASHAQTPRGSAARRAASPLHVTPGRPVQSKGHPGVSGSGPPSVAVTEQSALGVSPPPRPIAQEARPSPHGPQSAWQLLSSHWKGWGGTVGGAWSCLSRAHCAPPPGEQRGPVLSQCLRAPS